MKIIKPYYEILTPITGDELKRIEIAGRTCYKSEDKITEDSAAKFVRALIKGGHEAMIEHSQLSVRFVVDRGVSHELVRHRIASFAQESTRYCNYSKDKFGEELTFIKPCFFNDEVGDDSGAAYKDPRYDMWLTHMKYAEDSYMRLLYLGAKPEQARTVLPNSIKTEVVMTANYREWRNFFKLRAARATGPAHPQMEEIAVPLLMELNEKIPVVFEDIVKLYERKHIWNDDYPSPTLEEMEAMPPKERADLKPGWVKFNSEAFETIKNERGLTWSKFEAYRNGIKMSTKTVKEAWKNGTATEQTVKKLAKWLDIPVEKLIIA